jgi:hypothetical protein
MFLFNTEHYNTGHSGLQRNSIHSRHWCGVTATMAARTRQYVRPHVHRLSCFSYALGAVVSTRSRARLPALVHTTSTAQYNLPCDVQHHNNLHQCFKLPSFLHSLAERYKFLQQFLSEIWYGPNIKSWLDTCLSTTQEASGACEQSCNLSYLPYFT